MKRIMFLSAVVFGLALCVASAHEREQFSVGELTVAKILPELGNGVASNATVSEESSFTHLSKLTVNASVPIVYGGTNASCWGNKVIYTFPTGSVLQVVGARYNLTCATNASLLAASNIVYACGSASNTSATLTSTQTNICPPLGTALGVSSNEVNWMAQNLVLDNTSASTTMYLNIGVAAKTSTTAVVTGTVDVYWRSIK